MKNNKDDIIIVGCPRSGKTTLANMLANNNSDYFVISLDSLIKAFKSVVPEFGIIEKSKVTEISKKIIPFIVKYLEEFKYDYPEKKYIIEGIQFNPEDIVKEPFFGDAKKVCLGYPNANINEVFFNIRKNDKNLKNSYTSDMSDDELYKRIQFYLSYSKFLKRKCKECEIPFYETDICRDEVLDKIYNTLILESSLDKEEL